MNIYFDPDPDGQPYLMFLKSRLSRYELMARMTIVQLRQLANGAAVIMEKLIGRLRCCTSFSRSRRPGGIVPPGSYRTDATAYCHPAPVIVNNQPMHAW